MQKEVQTSAGKVYLIKWPVFSMFISERSHFKTLPTTLEVRGQVLLVSEGLHILSLLIELAWKQACPACMTHTHGSCFFSSAKHEIHHEDATCGKFTLLYSSSL